MKDRYVAESREIKEQVAASGDTEDAGRTAASPTPRATVPPPTERARREARLARVATFGGEIDPFELSLLDSGHFVLYRKVWRDGSRYVQGLLLERERLLRDGVAAGFRNSGLARMSELAVAWRGDVMLALSAAAGRDYLQSAGELQVHSSTAPACPRRSATWS